MLTVDPECELNPFRKSADIRIATEDAISGTIVVAKGERNPVAVVNVGLKELGVKLQLEPVTNSSSAVRPYICCCDVTTHDYTERRI